METLLELCCRQVARRIKKEDVPYIPSDLYESIQRHMERRRMVAVFDVHRTWHKNGQLSREYAYKDGRGHGMWRRWSRDGQLIDEERHINGKICGLATKWYYGAGLLMETEYKHGKPHGLLKVYFLNGNLANQTEFKEGDHHGMSREWNEHGRLMREAEYRNGSLYRWRKFVGNTVHNPAWNVVQDSLTDLEKKARFFL